MRMDRLFDGAALQAAVVAIGDAEDQLRFQHRRLETQRLLWRVLGVYEH